MIAAADGSESQAVSAAGIAATIAGIAATPFVWGPSPAAVPFFVWLACAAMLGLLAPLGVDDGRPRILLLLLAVAACIGRYPGDVALPALLASLVGMSLCMAVGSAAGRRPLLVMAMMLGIAIAATINALSGLIQYAGLGPQFGPWIYPGAVGEAMGNLRQRNQLATLLNMGLVAIWWLAGHTTPRHREKVRPGLLCVALLMVLALAATASRTGLLQLAILVSVAALWAPSALRPAVALLMAYLGASWLLPGLLTDGAAQGIYERLGDRSEGCLSRSVLWSNVVTLIAQKPLAGWGWGELDYAHFATLYAGPRFCDILDNAHNLPLHLAVELGIPASLVLCSLMGWMIWRARPWRETKPTRRAAWMLLVLVLLHSMLEYPLWFGIFQMIFALCLGMLWPATGVGARGVRAYRTAAVALAVACAFAALQYHRVGQLYIPSSARTAAYRNTVAQNVGKVWPFEQSVIFAELTTARVTPQNAARMRDLAATTIHFSPEPRVIEKAIASASMLGLETEAQWYEARYRAAFAADHAAWAAARPAPASQAR